MASIFSGSQIPFRRMSDPLVIPVGPTAQRFDIPANFIPSGANSFWVVNANNFWVRLKGSPGPDAPYTDITDTQGWLWKPGYSDVFTTQFPVWISTIAVTRQGLSAGSGFIELAYGMGG